MTTNQHENICLASSFLPMTDAWAAVWNRFDERLQESGHRLVMLTTAETGPLRFPTIRIPFMLAEFGQIFPSEGSGEDERIRALVKRDVQWVGRPSNCDAVSINGYHACTAFYRAIINELEPAFALPWGATLPQSDVFIRVLQEHAIPFKVQERGLLPNTLMIESIGNSVLSDLNCNPALAELIIARDDERRYEEIREYYLSTRAMKYPQSEYVSGAEFLTGAGLETKTVITFFGQNDCALGIVPRSTSLSLLQSPSVSSTREAVVELSRAVEALKNSVLLFKPHPHDRMDYDDLEGERLRVVRDVHIHTLIEASTVVVFSSSTLQFEALLFEKPMVLIAGSELRGKGIAYECRHVSELGPMLNQALRRIGYEARRRNARQFIVGVMDHFLYGYDESVPTRKQITDLADAVADLSLPRRATTSAVARVERFKQLLEQRRTAVPSTLGLTTSPLRANQNRLERAEELIERNELRRATTLLRAILHSDPSLLPALNNYAVVCVLQQQPARAEALLQTVLEIDPANAIARENFLSLQSHFPAGERVAPSNSLLPTKA